MCDNFNTGDKVSFKHAKGGQFIGIVGETYPSVVTVSGLSWWRDAIFDITVLEKALPKEPGVGSVVLVTDEFGDKKAYIHRFGGWSDYLNLYASWADLNRDGLTVTVLYDAWA